MPPDEYIKAHEKALSDLEDRVQRRDLLNAEIAGLRETVRVLSNLVPMTTDRQRRVAQLLAMVDYATPNLTDSVRAMLMRFYPKEMTAIEVRNALEESGFNFDDFSNSLAACHAALKRMLSDEQVELGKPKDGKASYRAVLKLEPLPGIGPFPVLELLASLAPTKTNETAKAASEGRQRIDPVPGASTPADLKRKLLALQKEVDKSEK